MAPATIMPHRRWTAVAASAATAILTTLNAGSDVVVSAFAPTSPAFHTASSASAKCGRYSSSTALNVANNPTRRTQQQQRRRDIAKFDGEEGSEASILDHKLDGSIPSDEAARRRMASARMSSIIDDGEGHINPDLARSIWEWENEHMKGGDGAGESGAAAEGDGEGEGEGGGGGESGGGGGGGNDFPAARLKFSTRSGLRIVDEVAREMLALTSDSSASDSASEASSTSNPNNTGGASYSDLCQEGTIALMRAIAKYDPSSEKDTGTTGTGTTFETYARRKITKAVSRAVADISRPLRLPSKVYTVLQAAKRAAESLRSTLVDREPTLEEIAAKIRVTPDRLRFYGLVGRDAVPVEGTLEIYDPDAPPGSGLAFADEDAYAAQSGKDEALLHSGDTVLGDVVEDEDGWVSPREKLVAPLRDAIPDTVERGPDQAVLEGLMRHDVDDLLVKSLDERELGVIRMRFGLTPDADGTGPDHPDADHPVYREGLTFSEIGAALGISRQRAAQIEQGALDKLRENYSSVFVEQYLDDDHSAEVSM